MNCVNPNYIVRKNLSSAQIQAICDMRNAQGIPYPTNVKEVYEMTALVRPKFPDLYMKVPCRQCLSCRKTRAREWSLRCIHELESWDSGLFVTLTYDDEHVPLVDTISFGPMPNLVKSDLQKFHKRLRKRLEKPIKYMACGEYGERNFRAHFHTIIFGVDFNDVNDIKACWNKGFVKVDPIGPYQICYVAGYIQKKLNGSVGRYVYQGRNEPFQIQSQQFGLNFVNKHHTEIYKKEYCGTVSGLKGSVPRYYTKKDWILNVLFKCKSELELDKRIEEISQLSPSEFYKRLQDERVSLRNAYQNYARGLALRKQKL